MNKKLLYVIAGIICIVLICIILWHFGYTFDFKRDAVKFKNSYEAYNGLKSESGEIYKSITINKDNKIDYIDLDDLVKKLNSDSALIYLASPTDKINRACVETIIEIVDSAEVEKLYYYEISSGSKEYEDLISTLDKEDLELPNILVVKKGKIINCLNLDFITDDNIDNFDEKELTKSINDVILSYIKGPTLCDETCSLQVFLLFFK